MLYSYEFLTNPSRNNPIFYVHVSLAEEEKTVKEQNLKNVSVQCNLSMNPRILRFSRQRLVITTTSIIFSAEAALGL